MKQNKRNRGTNRTNRNNLNRERNSKKMSNRGDKHRTVQAVRKVKGVSKEAVSARERKTRQKGGEEAREGVEQTRVNGLCVSVCVCV